MEDLRPAVGPVARSAGREPRRAAAPVSAAGIRSTGRKRPRDATADLLGKCEGRFLAADVPALAQLVRLCAKARPAAAESPDPCCGRADSSDTDDIPASCVIAVHRLHVHRVVNAVARGMAARPA